MKNHILLLIGLVFWFVSSSPAHAAKVPFELAKKDFKTTIVGQFERYDDTFVYLRVKGAKQSVKIPRRYALNAPANYSKDLVVRLELPAAEFVKNNLPIKSKK